MSINEEAAKISAAGEEYYGTVVLLNAMPTPWAETLADGVTGMIRTVSHKDITGVEATPMAREVNWALLVSGKNATMCVPGCQVRYIIRQNSEETSFSVNPHFIE